MNNEEMSTMDGMPCRAITSQQLFYSTIKGTMKTSNRLEPKEFCFSAMRNGWIVVSFAPG